MYTHIILKVLELTVLSFVFVVMSYYANHVGEYIFRNKRNRGFEKISEEQWLKDFTSALMDYSKLIIFAENENLKVDLPKRATKNSAGYDVFSPFAFELKPNEEIKIPTGFKAYMNNKEKLVFHTRSGNGFKYIRLANGTGIGDSDYYDCESNEGHYWVKLRNEGNKNFSVNIGDAIAQCIFENYLLIDGDNHIGNNRVGGFGSTDKK